MLFSFIMLCNRLKMSKYEVHWLMGFPLINTCQEVIIVIFLKETSIRKKNVILQSMGIIVIKSKGNKDGHLHLQIF